MSKKCNCHTPGLIRESCPVHGDSAKSTRSRVIVIRDEDGALMEVATVRKGETPFETFDRRCAYEAKQTGESVEEVKSEASFETMFLVA